MRRCLKSWPRLQPLALISTLRGHATPRSELTQQEWDHLQQEPAPRELLRQVRCHNELPKNVESEELKVPGDSFGIMHNRVTFQKPVPRPTHTGEMAKHFPPGLDPRHYMHPTVLKRLCGQYGLTEGYTVELFRECSGDLNLFVQMLVERKKIASAPFGAFSLVALESYVPETFCFVSFTLPSFEATRDESLLEAVHELVLSAAEMPMDTPQNQLVQKFLDWTADDGTSCSDLMKSFDIAPTAVLFLPHGEYSAQGFAMLHPLDALGFPNIGCGAAACCLDLRTGIHNRFRFHVERMADNVSEHVLNEQLHMGQEDHMLRQAYWFNPEYSVEEFLRFKENLLQPSASIFEMRYGVMLASSYGLPHFRNIVEMEKLKVAQHKHEKHYEDMALTGSYMTSDRSQLQTAAASSSATTAGSFMHRQTTATKDADTGLRAATAAVSDTLAESIQRHGDYALKRFYRNNFH
jgi:hypothetical protein